MFRSENERKNHAVLAAVIVFLLLLAVSLYHTLRPGFGRLAADFFYPYLRVSKIAVNYLSDRTLLTFNRLELAAKLEQQQKVNEKLAVQAAMARDLMRENLELRRYLKLQPMPQWDYLFAEVVIRDPLLWMEHFSINLGTLDDIAPGNAVLDVSDDGIPVLVGVIASAGKHHSEVMTVFNPEFCFSVRIMPENTIGFIHAGGRKGANGMIPLGYLPPGGEPVAGSAVFTTGFERNIPGGIKVGLLEDIERQNPLFSASGASGLIRPAFNPNSLRVVIVAKSAKKAAAELK